MKIKNMLLSITLGMSLTTSYGAEEMLSRTGGTSPAQLNTVTIKLSSKDGGTALCEALVLLYPEHMNVRFSNCVPAVLSKHISEESLLSAIQKVLNSTLPFINVVYVR